MAKDLIVKAYIEGGEIRCKAQLGQTAKVYIEHDHYRGQTEVTPSMETQVLETDNLVVDGNITINPAPAPDLRPLTVDSLTQQGTYLPTGDGFSQVTVEDDWDGIIYPIPDDPDKIFNAKWIPVSDGDTIIIDCYGRGRCFGSNGTNKIDNNTMPNSIAINILPSPYFAKFRATFTVTTLADDANVVLAGYQWTPDGTHSSNEAYQFRGEYMRWKLIHAS